MGPAETLQAAQIARRYFLDDKSKLEIADEFGISRFKVARLLAKARTKGIVRIVIENPEELDTALSGRLAEAYGLRHALVVQTSSDDDESVRDPLGHAGAELLAEMISADEILGMAMGRTLAALTDKLTRLPRCTVVQLTGAVASESVIEGSVELVRRVARASGGAGYPIYAPLYVSKPSTARSMRDEPAIGQALRRHLQVTTAVVAVGAWEPAHSTVYDALPNVERQALRDRGVVAECCTVPLTSAGDIVTTDVSDHLIAITPRQLAAIPHVIAVAGGRSKRAAIRAALNSGLIHSLVTDIGTAHYLLSSDQEVAGGKEMSRSVRA